MGNEWGIGQGGDKSKNNGVLVLVVMDRRRIEIKTPDLDGRFSSSWTEEMLDDKVLPKFKRGDYAGGLTKCVEACANRLTAPSSWWEAGGWLTVWGGTAAWSYVADRRARRKCDICGFMNDDSAATPWVTTRSATRSTS